MTTNVDDEEPRLLVARAPSRPIAYSQFMSG